jgi:glutamyl-tRNA reductase
MHLFLLGVSHQTAPVDVREKLDFSSRDLGAAVEALAGRHTAAESVVLSTCNRSEIYVASEDAERARGELVAFLSSYHDLPPGAFAPHLFARNDGAVAQHLFRVAAGLDSIVVGEPQILGQVKHAFQVAADRHCVGPLLTRLFQSSFGVGKRVRTETTLGEGAVSVGYAAVALARKIFGRLDGRRVLVVGAGEISTLAAQHLRSQGVGDIAVTNRTMSGAQALAEAVGGRTVPWDGLTAAIRETDIVVTATGSQRPILTRDSVAAATGWRRTAPLFIVDVAVPRDVDPAVGEIEQVFLYNVDDLQSLVHENVSKRGAEMARAEAIVGEEVARFTTWRRSRSVVPTVVALRHRFEAIRKGELQRLNGKLAALSPDARDRVEEVTRLMIEKLLLDPTEQLKTLPDDDTQVAYAEMVSRLFRLRDEEDPGTSDARPLLDPSSLRAHRPHEP